MHVAVTAMDLLQQLDFLIEDVDLQRTSAQIPAPDRTRRQTASVTIAAVIMITARAEESLKCQLLHDQSPIFT